MRSSARSEKGRLGHHSTSCSARSAGTSEQVLRGHRGVELIAATTSKTGLRVQAERDHGVYPTYVHISDANMAAIGSLPHDFHGAWNYTLHPHP